MPGFFLVLPNKISFRNILNSMFEEKNLSSSTPVKRYLLFCCNSKGILYRIDT